MRSRSGTTRLEQYAIRNRLARCLLLIAALGSFAPAWLSAADYTEAEYRLKAAFLYNFARFTNWPEQKGDVFRLCLLGEYRSGDSIESLSGKIINNAIIEVEHLDNPAGIDGCDLVYIATSYSDNLAAVIAGLQQRPILTVSDIDRFIDQGGIIGFRIIDNKIRFEINTTAASRAGLSISSRLLSLASRVSVNR